MVACRQHPQVAIEAAWLVRVLAPAQFQVPLDQAGVAEFAGEALRELVQDFACSREAAAQNTRARSTVTRWWRATAAINAVFPWPLGRRITTSRSGLATARTIRR